MSFVFYRNHFSTLSVFLAFGLYGSRSYNMDCVSAAVSAEETSGAG